MNLSTRLNLLVLRCNSITETKNFYENLGFSFIEEQHGNSPLHFSCNLNGLVLELYPSSDKFPVDSCRLGFSCSNFIELSKSMNAEINQREGINFFVIRDPDNRAIEIAQP